jgi:glycosyltransferase involved in cell wall biosynthesis
MRVLHLTTSFPLYTASVSGVFIERLICNFSSTIRSVVLTPDCRTEFSNNSASYHVVVFCYAPKKWQILAHEPGGLPVALRSSPWHFMLVPPFFLSMLLHTVWQAKKNDLIHAHWSLNGIIAGLAGIITGKPVVTTLRGEDANRIQSSRVQRFLLRLCLRFSDAVTTVSGSMYKQLHVECPKMAKKIHFIPNGVNDIFFTLSPIKKNPEARIVLLGSLIPRKGIDTVLSAAALCKQQAWKMLIVGTGPEHTKLQNLATSEGIQERVCFIGNIAPEAVPSLLSEADIFIQASYSEGRPNTVLEAMAAGVPVIGSNIDGINELIIHKKNGLLFSAGKIEDLAEQMRTLLDCKQMRQELGLAGQKTIQEYKLTWSHCASTYAALYTTLTSERPES